MQIQTVILIAGFGETRTSVCKSEVKKVKVANTRLPSVGFRSWSRLSAVSLQVTWVINLAVGCHYFPLGLQLPPQPLRKLLPISLLGEQRHDGCEVVNSLPKTVTRQRRGSDLNPGPSAAESSTLTTRLPSHPQNCKSQVVISISAELAIKVATAHFSLTSNVTITVVSSKMRLRD